ncbi:hypothetical protein OSB04_024965 [Centaurea solstitialis]|uniref:RNA-directed DNA polymerase, eukaryota, reverse transcriptase zinc-binding domain protein n=1 Tax=Centaurea solstitialis TaxID=347529 RepID=A0AA38T6L1_9ASTR|nr:hypothetical protein OSB04_024965 [Centaurea solstitialis]
MFSSINDFLVMKLRGNRKFHFEYPSSVGKSSGLLIAWDPGLFIKSDSSASDDFLVCLGFFYPNSIKSTAKEFFGLKFQEPLPRPLYSSRSFKALSVSQSSDLEALFSVEEIKFGVWDCDGDKAQGLNGLYFAFIKKFWMVFESDFVASVKHFHSLVTIDQGSNSSFLTLLENIVCCVNL